ncbi:phosphatidate cytidylyltransferase [Siccirubricoccus phaeus]|uniref:phosphatidate cytidylyltransferase n=1 Tax=Siccirubricoccus phaeus TaxID=2595053 RepID=UPI001F3D1CAA|nr:phosphatidate cytidylyltransferase [Siccirubricoccus phaeus]
MPGPASPDAAPAPPGGPPPPARPAATRWPDLRKRALSAAILVPGALLCVWLGGAAWTALLAVAVALTAWEWVRLCGFSTARPPGLAVPLLVLAAGALALAGQWGVALALLPLGFLGLWVALRGGGRPGFWLGFGVLYIGLAGLALLHLRGDAAGLRNVLFLLFVVWASDIGAYLAGRLFGGPKLAPAISPNKTWSGAAGGLAAAMAVGLAAAYVMEPFAVSPPALRVALVAAGLGLLAQAGDLFESWIKRRFQVKDTSALIPGHGGLLDRLDGVLAAAPAAALLGVLLGPGESLWT